MLPFFTDPYKDELVYSAIARYHFYSGNLDYKDTLQEVFQNRSVIPSLVIGSHFTQMIEELGEEYSVDKLIYKHTIYPLYSAFLTKERQDEIIEDIKGDGRGLYTRLGVIAGGICKKENIYYCPDCASKDIKEYGEPYIHREHQLQGINVCPHHLIRLKEYSIDKKVHSRLGYIRLDKDKLEFEIDNVVKDKLYYLECKLSKMAYYLLFNHSKETSKEYIHKRYNYLLQEKGFGTVNGNIRQKELYNAFTNYYSDEQLEYFESTISVDNEYNWLKVLTRKSKRHVHPLRHLLFINFLVGNIEEIFENKKQFYMPFGYGPWPCLNKAAEHYNEYKIEKVKITRDYKSGNPIGTFKCECGFVYARKGPDKSEKDRYRIGRVKEFGDVWKKKLNELCDEQTLSINSISKHLGVDPKTIIRCTHVLPKPVMKTSECKHLAEYKETILKAIDVHNDISRTELRNIYKKEYIYLYRHDRNWLFNHLPKIKKKTNILNNRVDWNKRDSLYKELIIKQYHELLNSDKPCRVTKYILGKRVGILANLNKHGDKLPNTIEYLDIICESVEEFQIRRCKNIIKRLIINNEDVQLWKVQRLGGVKSCSFNQIKVELNEYIEEIINEVTNESRIN